MKTVLAHGAFDLLHYGHLKYLQEARRYGDRLVVSITADRFINKGPGRPYFPAERRAEMLRALGIVDEVFIVEGPTATPSIERYRPDIYAKGPDYRTIDPLSAEGLALDEEKRLVELYGGELIFTSGELNSSSAIINKFFSPFSEAQRETIEAVRGHGGLSSIERAIEEVSKLKVMVLGEPILDIYRFVRPEGISSKSPSISCRFEHEEVYRGGSWAIFNHLASFIKNIALFHGSAVHKKIRYISGTQRVFEVTEIDENYVNFPIPNDYDAYVIADFGHGMFKGGELDGLKGFVGLNVQTNSSNFGFNDFRKHKRFDYLCLDTRESRLALRDRYNEPLSLSRRIRSEINGKLSLTCGPGGAYFFGEKEHFSPAFADQVVDATGAGDAYFAITTVLLASGCDPLLVPFIGNVFAGLKTKIIGNKEAVTKDQLLKAIRGILA